MTDFSWEAFSQKKIIQPDQLTSFSDQLKKEGKTIATLNGSFDLLHAGHLFMLYEASKVADILIVALNSDASIQQYKSIHRPLIALSHRLEMLTAIEFVDYVTWFDETDPRALLTKIRPHVHVNGIEYGENCIEAETVKRLGGKLHLVPRIDGFSTSRIIEKIHRLPCD